MAKLDRLRVLVVDDNRHVRTLVKEVLGAVEARVREAADGREALAICRDDPPDIVIVDFEMPEMNGAAFTQALRTSEATRGLRTAVLMMTAHGDDRRVMAAARAGVDGLMAKPLTPQGLLTRINDALQRSAARRVQDRAACSA